MLTDLQIIQQNVPSFHGYEKEKSKRSSDFKLRYFLFTELLQLADKCASFRLKHKTGDDSLPWEEFESMFCNLNTLARTIHNKEEFSAEKFYQEDLADAFIQNVYVMDVALLLKLGQIKESCQLIISEGKLTTPVLIIEMNEIFQRRSSYLSY